MSSSRRDSGARPGSRPSSRTQTRPPARRGDQPKRRTTGTPAGPVRTRGSRNLTGRAAVVLLVLGALVVSYAQSLRVWFDQHSQITALQQEIRDREKRVAELNEEIQRWDDDAFVKAQARQRLGWVMPGEVGYRVIGADGKPVGAPPEPGVPADQAAEVEKPTWYTKLWGSVEGAGKPPAAPTKNPAKPTPKPILTPAPER
ncbi:septum formation initiator family protein [Kribbella sandramycini]|uniref:Cell division protein FtsB n=1 Tax=Kribbella sandramycini TaxID=60450 RepID=A0A7Y4L6B6_9ACTN|nr:septum formation initiator family protein [Kribbella sandramycini]MBB6571586.1 cell division protein FtsB [Kribbella sandramycini]NOL44232.1 septum formation initiator family protein [Kribbella sandramycini]